MANAVVTSDSTKIKVVFDGLASMAGRHTSYFKKSDLVEVYADTTDAFVTVVLAHNKSFKISTDGTIGTIQVDTVDGLAPSNNADLRDKMAAFIT